MVLPVIIAAAFLLVRAAAIQWTDHLQDGQIMHVCVGGEVHLPWQYQLGPQESVFSITWMFNGHAQEMMAMWTHGAFVALPTYGQRVQQSTNAGIDLHKVTLADSGRYSVEINGQDANGAFTINKTVNLQVADNLLTTDHQLHMSQNPLAVYINDTDSWHLQLNCGTFAYDGYPPFEVQWVSPSGVRYNSSSYSNNQFHLLVPNPVEEGSYTCEVPDSASLACLPQGTHSASELPVQSVLIRLMLLEAEQKSMLEQNNRLLAENQQLQALENGNQQRLAALETTLQHQQQALAADHQCCVDNNATLAALASQLHSLQQQHQTDQAVVMAQIHNLTSLLQHGQTSASSAKVAFHVQLTADARRHILTKGTTYLDIGNTVNANAIFVAPVTGTYFFVATTDSHAANAYVPLELSKEGAKVAEGLSVVHAVMTLQQGQHVQVAIPATSAATLIGHFPSLVGYFSGFLIHE